MDTWKCCQRRRDMKIGEIMKDDENLKYLVEMS